MSDTTGENRSIFEAATSVLSKVKAASAKSEQSRHFGPAACRTQQLAIIHSAIATGYHHGQQDALRAAADQLDREDVWGITDVAAWLRERATTLERQG